MLTFDIPEPDWQSAALAPEDRSTKGSGPPPSERLRGWVALGEPVAIPLTLARVGADDDLRHFIEEAGATHAFHLVHLACSFRPADDEPFAKAWLAVSLARSEGDGEAPTPIAWSMQPQRLSDAVQAAQTVRLGGALKLFDNGPGIESGAETTESWTRHDPFLEAFNELRADPLWEFTRTARAAIRGQFRLTLVVRAPRDVPTAGEVSLATVVQRRHFGLIPYTATLDEKPTLRFTLAPPPTAPNGEPATPTDERVRLRQVLDDSFDANELRTLCFDLGIAYDDLPGEGQGGKARELVAYCERHGHYAALRAAVRRLRPHEW